MQALPLAQLIGVDESGITAYAGPVSAAAVEPDPQSPYEDLVLDCKLLDSAQLETAHKDVIIKSKAWAVAYASVREVDRLGVQRSAQLAMRRAIRKIRDEERRTILLIDYTTVPGIHCLQYPLEDGDQIAACISAASVLAKYFRDQLMCDLSRLRPGSVLWPSPPILARHKHPSALVRARTRGQGSSRRCFHSRCTRLCP